MQERFDNFYCILFLVAEVVDWFILIYPYLVILSGTQRDKICYAKEV